MSNSKNKTVSKIIEILTLVVLIIFSGTRYRLGGYDYGVYERIFYNSPSSIFELGNIFNYGTDFLYYLFNSFVKGLGFNFYGFTLIESILFHLLLYRGIKKNNINFGLFIIIFLYKLFIFNTFVSMRQSLALVIFFNCIPLIKEDKSIKYIIIMTFTSFLHSSAIILVPLIFINKVNFTKKLLVLYSSVFFVLFLMNIFDIYRFNPTYFLSEVFKSNSALIAKVNLYSEANTSINILSTIETYIITLLVIFFYNKIYVKESNKIYINLFLLIIPIVTFFRSYEVIVRLRDYFSLFIPFVLFYIFKEYKNKDKMLLYIMTTIICFAGFYRYIYTYGGLTPYRSYIFEDVSIFK